MRKLTPGIAFAGALALAFLLTPALAQKDSEAEREKICAEAGERYKELFGKEASGEAMPIVMMYRYHFCPGGLTVKPGVTVRWVNVDKRTSHSVWFRADGKEESVRLFAEEHVEMAIDLAPGEHEYLCGPHWEKEGMRGRLEVQP